MPDEVPPALTAEEWEDYRRRGVHVSISSVRYVGGLEPHYRHQAAALALDGLVVDGKAAGFTRAGLAALEFVYQKCAAFYGVDETVMRAHEELQKIAALLPPEEGTNG
jgi:hypothetical protein